MAAQKTRYSKGLVLLAIHPARDRHDEDEPKASMMGAIGGW
jgi:hypothetical protein